MRSSKPFDFDGPVEIVAHRGYSARAPENTIAALELGIAAGADALEFDLHTALDGTAYLFHDDTLERTTDGSGPIGATSPERLSALDAGSWFDARFRGEAIPTLEQALSHVCGRVPRLYPEVKGYGGPADLARMVRLVERGGLLERTVFISMDWSSLHAIRAAAPDALVGYIVEHPDRIDEGFALAAGDAGALLDFDARILLDHPALGERARREDVALATWTVDEVAVATRLLELGVPRITTNRVADLVAWKRTL